MKKGWLFLVFAVSLIACNQQNDYQHILIDPGFYSRTVKQLNNVVLGNNFPPMIASRNYVYANIAAYECIVAGDNRFASLSGQIKHLPAMPKPDHDKKYDFNFASVLAFCKVGQAVTFPEGSMSEFVDSMKTMMKAHGMPSDVFDNSVALADTIGSSILKWSKGDKYARLRSAEKYTVTETPGRWIPTPPMYAQAIEPHWNEMRCLLMDTSSQFMPVRPPAFNTAKGSAFYNFANEVKMIGDSLTDEQKHIANFWDDNPFNMHVQGHVMYATKKFNPAGHWMNICGIASMKAKADFGTNVMAHTMTAIALFDGFISCWDEKYRSNLLRPETYISKYIFSEWQPFIQTPPFPSYTSGHSTITAAACEVLTSIYGENFAYKDSSEREFGIPDRSFTSFKQAAQEASISRVYGGIHYKFDCDEGNKAGTKLGMYIVGKLKLRKE
jgi:hypothetical protein